MSKKDKKDKVITNYICVNSDGVKTERRSQRGRSIKEVEIDESKEWNERKIIDMDKKRNKGR